MDPQRVLAIRLFSGLAAEDLQFIAALARESQAPQGATLVRQGELAYELIAIEQGRVVVRRDDVAVAELGAGDVFGELGVMGRRRRSASVVSLSAVRLITLTGWDLRRLGRRAPEVLRRVQVLVAERERAVAAGEGA